MNLLYLQNKLVAVLGFGQEGRATINYLIKHGIKPVLFDVKPWQEWLVEDQEYIKSLRVNFIFGPGYLQELKGFDVAFRSPGIKLQQLTINNLQLTSQTKWFFENCPAKIIGVTGTKGKGTTSSLIYEILKGSVPIHGRPISPINRHATGTTYLTGNIGKTQPFEILDDLKADDYVVYELSSFQLQDLQQSPHIGVVLMTTSEHLDYHADQKEYLEAKSAITKFQTPDNFAVINADFENSMAIGKLGQGKKVYFSRKKTDVDCYVKNESVVFVGSCLGVTANSDAPGRVPTEQTVIDKISDLQLPGAHNLENVCAAVSVAKILGVDDEVIRQSVVNFKGLEHRLEFVAKKNGVKYYNDSFSTTPETTIAAINAFDEPKILILGGSEKQADFTEMVEVIATSKSIKTVIVIGPEGQRIDNLINQREIFSGNLIMGPSNMQEIFECIKPIASPGDVVLLSPACASFGMFENYKDRGAQFKKAVLDIK